MRSAKLAEVDLDYVLGVGGFDLERFVHGYTNVERYTFLRMVFLVLDFVVCCPTN